MEDKNKLIYAEYKASIHMHGLMAYLARKYNLSRQRISAIIKSMEPEAKTPKRANKKIMSLLTDGAIDALVALMGIFPGVSQQQIIEVALREYLHQQSEYQEQKEPINASKE